MRAISMVMILGVVAVGAGAILAVATTPAFTPYAKRGVEQRTPLVAVTGKDQIPAYFPEADAPESDDAYGFRIRPGFQQGTIVLELPRWAGETQAWMERGRRAWHDWRDLIEPDRETSSADNYSQGYGSEDREDREDRSYGYRDRDEDFESDQYAGPAYWADRARQSYDVGPQRYAEAPKAARRTVEPSVEDEAARAARLAQDAARDVRAAEAL